MLKQRKSSRDTIRRSSVRHHSRAEHRSRIAIADLAARFLAEGLCADIGEARNKAAEKIRHQAGGPMIQLLPSNEEIEAALITRNAVFDDARFQRNLRELRESAIAAMRFLSPFQPRAVGGVITGAIGEHAAVELHVFVDAIEELLMFLHEHGVPFESSLQTLRRSNGSKGQFDRIQFLAGDIQIDLIVFTEESGHQPPLSPVDQKPMLRLSLAELKTLARGETQRSAMST